MTVLDFIILIVVVTALINCLARENNRCSEIWSMQFHDDVYDTSRRGEEGVMHKHPWVYCPHHGWRLYCCSDCQLPKLLRMQEESFCNVTIPQRQQEEWNG